MAKYKEIWESFDDPTVIGYMDTEEGGSIPLAAGNRHYRMVQEWLAEENVADPAYTFAERQAMALSKLEGVLDEKLRADVLYGGELIKADKKHKDDMTFRIFAGDKAKSVKVKKADKSLKLLVDKGEIEAMLTAIGDRDDLAYDNYEIAVAAVNAATDWAGVEAAIAAFEGS